MTAGLWDSGEHQVGDQGPPGGQAGHGQAPGHLRQEQVGEHEQVSEGAGGGVIFKRGVRDMIFDVKNR